jgi:hypothetical protein
MGYYWKGQWVGGDTVDDAIHFIADQIDASQSPKSMPSCCREQALGRVLRPADGKDERSGGAGLKRS